MAKIEIRRKRTKTGEEEDKTRTRAQQRVIRKQPNSNREDVEENRKGWDTDEKVKRETRATRKQSKQARGGGIDHGRRESSTHLLYVFFSPLGRMTTAARWSNE